MPVGELRFLIAAVVLHMVVPVAAVIAPDPVRALYGKGKSRLTEIEVDITSVRPPTALRDAYPTTLPVGVHRSVLPLEELPLERHPSTMLPELAPVPAPTDTSTPAADDEPPFLPEPRQPQAPEGYDQPPDDGSSRGRTWLPGQPWSPMTMVPDTAGPPRLAAPTTIAPRKATDPRIAQRVLERTIRAKDRKLNLDLPAASRVASILRDAVSGSAAPTECQGSFSVLLGGDGRVVSISLLSFSGGSSGLWHGIRKAAKAQLAASQFPMRSSYAKGAVITVSVRSQLRMPSGDGGLKGASVSFDPTNLGARPTRHVTASFSVQALE